jgi:hypothetical protein
MKISTKLKVLEWVRVYLGVTFFALMLYFKLSSPSLAPYLSTGLVTGVQDYVFDNGQFVLLYSIFGGLAILMMFLQRRLHSK